jgi:superfamily I DNA/RNA helicase
MAFAPTSQQVAFIDALLNTTANIALVARAGCGKTSSILLGVTSLVKANPRVEIAVCSYNTPIAAEISGKLKEAQIDWKNATGATAHAMGFGLVKFVYRLSKDDVDAKKVLKIIDGQVEPVYRDYGAQIAQLVSYAKQAGFGFFPDKQIGDTGAWYDLAEHHDINGFDDTSDMDGIVKAAQDVYRLSLDDTKRVDFDDMILFPLVKNLRVKFQKDFVFLDEAQDTSPARQALVRKFIKPGTGRLIIVGDDRQAIYGFSGADSAAMPNMIRDADATVLPLSVTWRCPKAVVRLAQAYVPDIEFSETAPEGEVNHLSIIDKETESAWIKSLTPADAILCRNKAPLIATAYKLIRAGKACKVEGRDIGTGLQKLARRWKTTDLEVLIERLETYEAREVQKYQAKDNEERAEAVQDQVATMMEIINACIAQGKSTVADVCQFIDDLFADDAKGVVILATYHKSKGREWDNVYLWEHNTRCPSKWARKPWQAEQEQNLAYVAITRAKATLTFIG